MKTKLLFLSALMAVMLTTPAFAETRVVKTATGEKIVQRASHRHRDRHDSHVSFGIGLGFGYPGYYGDYYGGYPGYYGTYPGYYGGYYPYGQYYGGYYGSRYRYYPTSYYRPYHYRGSDYGYGDNIVARVQQRLARAGYYQGAIDGVIGPRTRYAIRAYERRHGLPVDGQIDRRLLATMGLA